MISTDSIRKRLKRNPLVSPGDRKRILSELRTMDLFEQKSLLLILDRNELSLQKILKEGFKKSREDFMKNWTKFEQKIVKNLALINHKMEEEEADQNFKKQLNEQC